MLGAPLVRELRGVERIERSPSATARSPLQEVELGGLAEQRPIADVRNQPLGLALEPLLIAEEEEDEHHRAANQMVVEIALQESEPVAEFDQMLRCRLPLLDSSTSSGDGLERASRRMRCRRRSCGYP